jgi:hypothetical protein
VAARLDPYSAEIEHGMNGMLASTHDEWIDCLSQLVQSADLRHRLGQAARMDALTRHTTAARAANFSSILARCAQ